MVTLLFTVKVLSMYTNAEHFEEKYQIVRSQNFFDNSLKSSWRPLLIEKFECL